MNEHSDRDRSTRPDARQGASCDPMHDESATPQVAPGRGWDQEATPSLTNLRAQDCEGTPPGTSRSDTARATPAQELVALSRWIDAGNAHRDPEAVLWGRVPKIAEEHGEATEALIGWTGQNPRKGVTHAREDLVEELLDVAVTALGAIEHVRGHDGKALDLLELKIRRVAGRALAGPEPEATKGGA